MTPSSRDYGLSRRTVGQGLLASSLVAGPASAAPISPDEPKPYQPRAIPPPTDAPYLTPEGRVRVVGYNDMHPMLERICALFTRAHPAITFQLELKGTRTAPAALISGVSAFAPMGAEFEAADLAAYRYALGTEPLGLRVAHDSLDPRALSSPTGLYVHRANPLTRIDLETAARAFCAGPGSTAAAQSWGELGLRGAWEDRPLHAIGLAPATAIGRFMRRTGFNGSPYRSDLTGLPQSRQVVAAVAADPLAIGFANLNHVRPEVRALAIARSPGAPVITPTADAIRAGRYALDRCLLIYVRRAADVGPDPLVREYLRLVLSREGQRAVAADDLSYIPLDRQDAEAELRKLEL